MHFEAKKRIAYSVRFTSFVRPKKELKRKIVFFCTVKNSEFGAKELILILS